MKKNLLQLKLELRAAQVMIKKQDQEFGYLQFKSQQLCQENEKLRSNILNEK